MTRWRHPETGYIAPGILGGPPARGKIEHSYGPYEVPRHPHDFHGRAHGPSNYPFGTEHLFAKNERPPLTGWGYVRVFDQKPERGEMIAKRIREELEAPPARRIKDFFKVRVAPRQATVSDVRSLHDQDVVVAVLGKGGEATAMQLFEAVVERFHKRMNGAAVSAETQKKFTVLGGGITLARVAVVPVAAASPFGGDETLIGNIAVHEFGHAISTLGYDKDHRTGGVMQPVIGTAQSALHFTAEFLKQF